MLEFALLTPTYLSMCVILHRTNEGNHVLVENTQAFQRLKYFSLQRGVQHVA